MEKQVTRFPHVAVKIFDYLDIRSLAKSREVCKLWKIFIEGSKFSWIKFIEGFLNLSKQSEEIQRQWKRVLLMGNIKQIMNIAYVLQAKVASCSYDPKYSLFNGKLVLDNFSPLFLLAELKDSVNLYKDVCNTIPDGNINPIIACRYSSGSTCLHFALYSNQVDLFTFIIENVKEKNPKAQSKCYDLTPLHVAAKNGNLEICKIIIANVGDLSCLDEKSYHGHGYCGGKTPFELARAQNHLEICFYFNYIRNLPTLNVGWNFNKNVSHYFLEESESTAVASTTTTTTETTETTETTSIWSKFWNYMKQ